MICIKDDNWNNNSVKQKTSKDTFGMERNTREKEKNDKCKKRKKIIKRIRNKSSFIVFPFSFAHRRIQAHSPSHLKYTLQFSI